MAGHEYNPTPFEEVQDTDHWGFFEHLFDPPVAWQMPTIYIGNYPLHITKFMVLELVAALLIILIYVPLARYIQSGGLPKGRFWNFFELLLVFIRDNVARPSINIGHGHAHNGHGHDKHHEEGKVPAHSHGEHHAVSHAPEGGMGHQPEPYLLGGHPADAYVPFLWTAFLFILFCNLLGMIPTLGSPTASIWMTAGMALISYVVINLVVIMRYGFGGFLKTVWVTVEMPKGLPFFLLGTLFITPLLSLIETAGLIIKCTVLAIRLFANMFAGHLVLASIMVFIFMAGKALGPHPIWGTVTAASVLGTVAMSLLELFVAFLQAFIFTFLTAIFMGMQMAHAEHH